jgi:Kef-type K+ transport system membrane component KefB
MSTAFFAIGLVIALAALLGAWSSFLKLPLILAYIVTGIIVGPFLFKNGVNNDIFLLLRDLGLSFLLFLVGLEINTSELKQFGRQALTTGIVQIVGCALVAFLLSLMLGFSFIASFYVSLALTLSSTVIVVKLLNEKRDYDSLYGKLTVAILLLQDLVAILFLIIFSDVKTASGNFNLVTLILTVLSGALLLGLIYFLNRKILPYIFERLARNLELLFLSSIAWLFIVVALASSFNFSLEIGAFIAGLGLASLKQEHQIASRVKPLRDFFLVIFFIVLGSQIVVNFSFSILYQALVFSAFVLLIKPVIVLITLGRLGFKRRTGFMTGISLAQVSEFSLIVVFLGLKNGAIDEHLVAVITLTALVTIAVSSYTLVSATKIYRSLERYLKIFETKGEKLEVANLGQELNDHVVLIGCDRLGGEVLKQLQKQGKDVLVVDFNPTIITFLKEAGINHLFGDITDPEIWDQARISKASLVISTVFDPSDTEELLSKIKNLETKPLVFVTAAEKTWAVTFYKRGADYVIIPRILSGHQVAHLLSNQKLAEIRQVELKNDHLEELREKSFG